MYWIIEPHSDDAYLSLHDHIVGLWQGRSKGIITCYGTGAVIDEAKYYAQAVGCEIYKSLGLKETGWVDVQQPPPLEEWLSYEPGDTVVLPLGIRQPAHKAIARITVPKGLHALWYLDAKYIQPTANWEVMEKTAGRRIHSLRCASSEKHHYKNIFVSQAHRFMLAPDLYPPMVEIILQ